jgi:hypothetical protein
LEGGAQTLFAFDGDFAAVRFDEGFHDGEPKPQAALFLRASLQFVENLFEMFFRESGAVVTHLALDETVIPNLHRLDQDLSARCEFDGVCDQVLKNAPQETRVCIDDQTMRDFIDELGAARSSDGTKIMDEPFDQRPQIKLAPLQFNAGFRLEIGVFLDDFFDQPLQILDVASEGFQHLGSVSALASFPKRDVQNPGSQGNGIERRAKIVRHESEIFFAAPLHFERPLGRVGLDSQADRLIEHPVHNVEGLALQVEAVLLCEIVNTAAQDVVFGDNFFEIESFLETL